MPLPQMRTINKFYDELVQEDPDTAAAKKLIRRIIVNGTVPSVQVGRKYIFDKEMMIQYLNGSYQPTQPTPVYSTIRQIPEK